MLLVHVLHQCFERWPIRFDTVRKRIATKYFVDFLDLVLQPRQHRRKRPSIAQARSRNTFGFDERGVQARRDPRISLVHLAPDGDEMPDREDLAALVKLAFQFMM